MSQKASNRETPTREAPTREALGREAVQLRLTHRGEELAVAIRRNPRARRLSLKVDPVEGAVLVLPPGVSDAEGRRMIERHAGWLARRLSGLPQRIDFAPGASIPLRGDPHRILHVGGRGLIAAEAGEIRVTGNAEHLRRRLTDWLKAEARHDVLDLVADKTARLGRPAGRITVRDQRSRWGSCAFSGNLAFNWRLILAPAEVLDYVVAHEVAHLKEHNHGPRFWALVAQLTPYHDTGRAWLRRNGTGLHRYG